MQREAMDFSVRANPSELAEWMDEPCTYEEFKACLIDLEKVNRLTLAQRPTLLWLERLLGRGQTDWPVRIVDVGSGSGQMLRSIAVWARAAEVPVKLTGIDLNPYAARAARELSASFPEIEWVTDNAYAYMPPGGIDVVISSLFTHHLPDAEVVRFMEWMESTTRRGWFINDLHRLRWAHGVFGHLAKVMRWHRFVQHDGPVSIRRSFRAEDWCRIGEEVGVSLETLRIEAYFPGRLCVGRLK